LLVRSMMADLGDEERLASGVDRTGLLYAIVNGTVKLGFALAAGVFVLLARLGFDPKVHSAGGDAALVALYVYAPAILGLLVSAIMLRYPLDAAAHAQIRRQLEARDAATPVDPEPKPDAHAVFPAAAPRPAD
jgi:Na+/melibiose symporter-like transporter